jgi:hypothetical protein
MKTKGPIKDAVEILDEEVARLDKENARLRGMLMALLKVAEYSEHNGSDADGCAACATVNRVREGLKLCWETVR